MVKQLPGFRYYVFVCIMWLEMKFYFHIIHLSTTSRWLSFLIQIYQKNSWSNLFARYHLLIILNVCRYRKSSKTFQTLAGTYQQQQYEVEKCNFTHGASWNTNSWPNWILVSYSGTVSERLCDSATRNVCCCRCVCVWVSTAMDHSGAHSHLTIHFCQMP